MPSKDILLIDDSKDILVPMKRLLQSEGYATVTAMNGQEALDLLRVAVKLPDLILLDMMMPVMDGATFCAERKKDPRLALIPIVIISASATHTESLGVNGYIPKPVDADVLLETVETFLGK